MLEIKHHTQLIQALIDKHNLKSYLEIGINEPFANFRKINCEMKHGIDPALEWANDISNETSDAFFERYYSMVNNRTIFDICFIDGLHHSDQVKRDFENSLRCLSDNGFILIHDVLPENEAGTIVPRETKVWWGDVYKWAMSISDYRLEYLTYNIDNGCMVVQKKPISWNADEFVNLPTPIEPTWYNFNLHKQRLLRITDEVII